jgi:NitT/TauT family transport system substrate-binding protein
MFRYVETSVMKQTSGLRTVLTWVAALVGVLLFAAACGDADDPATADDETTTTVAADDETTTTVAGDDETTTTAAGDESTTSERGEPATLRLGYFPNVTHAPAIIGVDEGLFAAALGADVELELVTFNSGTEAVEALFGGAIDASFIGPNPAINGFAQSNGEALRIVSGTTSGGASLVVREGIDTPADLTGTTLATPSLGNTQDVALRAWLAEQGLETDTAGGGDVEVRPQENADTLATFTDGAIDGAWVPEPWATRLVNEGGGHVLVDEADLWPDGRFVTTHLIVATEYLDEHPDIVRNLISGLLDTLELIESDPEQAKTLTNQGIEAITTKPLAQETIDGAWENLEFTYDPVQASLEGSKEDAVTVGLLEPVDLDGIYDLTLLNEVLAERGLEEVTG